MTGSDRIWSARESIEDALQLSGEHMGNKVIMTKLYHAMIDALIVLLDVHEIGRLTHADLIEQFEREYVVAGRIDKVVIDAVRRAYGFTHECDCNHMPVPTDEEIAASQRVAEYLFQRAVAMQKKEVTDHEGSAI